MTADVYFEKIDESWDYSHGAFVVMFSGVFRHL